MTRLRPSVLLSAAILLPAPLAAQAATSSRSMAAPMTGVHDAVRQVVVDETVPGDIVVVRHHGRQVFAEAAGEADGMPLKTDTVFWVASMTKPLVATTVMMMVDEGKVRLDDPVSKFIPEFSQARMVRTLKPGSPPIPIMQPGMRPDPSLPQPEYDLAPASRPLTVRDFITMTAGLQTIRIPNPGVPQVSDTDTVATYTAKLGGAPLDFQPGSRWAYSNATEFEILVRVVEVASGTSYADFVQRRVFDPLGMKDSHFGVREDLRDRTAPLGQMANSPLRTGRFTSGSAGLWTTAEDYSHLGQMFLNQGSYNGHRLLTAASVRAMSHNEIGDLTLGGVTPDEYGGLTSRRNAGVRYGYGLMVITDPVAAGVALPAGSYGWDGVGSRRFWVDPKDGVVLVMLTPGGKAGDAHRVIESATMKAIASAK